MPDWLDEMIKTMGPVFRWFAWHPTNTEDRGWRWLTFVNRRRITVDHEYGHTTWFATSVKGARSR